MVIHAPLRGAGPFETGTGGCAPRSGASHRLPSSVPTAPALKPPVQFRGLKPTVLHEVAPRSNRGGFLQAPCYAMKTPTLPPFNYQPRPYTGPSADEVFALRKQFLNPAIFHYYKKPIMIVEGRGQWLFDETGRRYLDGIGGIVTVSVGHCHPRVVAAARARAVRSIGRRRQLWLRLGSLLWPLDPSRPHHT